MKNNKKLCDGNMCFHGGRGCLSVNKKEMVACTLKEGHRGPHIACGTSTHNIAIWNIESNIHKNVKRKRK